MAFGKKHKKVQKPQTLRMKKRLLDSIRDGHVQVRPCLKPIKGYALSEELKQTLFHEAVLHVPTEIDYLVSQTVEGMGYEEKDVRIAFYEGREELQFEIFPPEPV